MKSSEKLSLVKEMIIWRWLDYPCFKENYKMIEIDLSKEQALDTDPIANPQINFTVNLNRDGDTRMFFMLETAKINILCLSQRTVRVL